MAAFIKRACLLAMVVPVFFPLPAQSSVNGLIVRKEIDNSGNGYSVVRVWGSYTDMGYAQGYLFASQIEAQVASIQGLVGPADFRSLKAAMNGTQFRPADVVEEIGGIVAGVKAAIPGSAIDTGDIRVMSTFGDWSASPSCRSHTCWGSFVQGAVKTLSTRRLDYPTPPVLPSVHHVLVVYNPSNPSKVRWINLTFPGMASVVTGVNEYGALCSLHDYQTGGPHATGANVFTRSFATRYLLTMNDLPADITAQLRHVYAAIQPFKCWTGTFINYYLPEGHGGVITCNQAEGFYNLRVPQPQYFNGEVMVTSNTQTDGKTTPSDADIFFPYYNGQKPKTLSDHWALLQASGNTLGFHQMSVAYRGKGDMTIWFDGRLAGGEHTPRVELEWGDLFGTGAITPGIRSLSKSRRMGTTKMATAKGIVIKAFSHGAIHFYRINGMEINLPLSRPAVR